MNTENRSLKPKTQMEIVFLESFDQDPKAGLKEVTQLLYPCYQKFHFWQMRVALWKGAVSDYSTEEKNPETTTMSLDPSSS